MCRNGYFSRPGLPSPIRRGNILIRMPRLSVFAVFLCPLTNEILLVHQRGDKWSLPGGRCFHGESPIAGLRREVAEETAFAIPADVQPTHTLQIRRRWRRRGRNAMLFFFHLRPPVRASSEVAAVDWFGLESLPSQITRTALAGIRECKVAIAHQAQR